MAKILTIAIPTYNRARHIGVLLDLLKQDLRGLESEVEVLVSDNASSDETPQVVAGFLLDYPSGLSLRNDSNIGADGNIGQCFNRAQSDYLWILGDDDAPAEGVVRAVVQLLKQERPDMVYLRDRWIPDVNEKTRGCLTAPLQYLVLSRLGFARLVNTSFTFISSNIVRRAAATDDGSMLVPGKLQGSSLIQMEWTFGALSKGNKFIYVQSDCVAATAGNTGGYGVLKTFLRNYPDIVMQMFSTQPRLAKALIARHFLSYLLHLLWALRSANVGKFTKESDPALYAQVRRYALYWLLVMPIYRFPKALTWPFRFFGRLLNKIIYLRDRSAMPAPRYLSL